jgi:hypothetical protein
VIRLQSPASAAEARLIVGRLSRGHAQEQRRGRPRCCGPREGAIRESKPTIDSLDRVPRLRPCRSRVAPSRSPVGAWAIASPRPPGSTSRGFLRSPFTTTKIVRTEGLLDTTGPA